jgi:hypothetical protein
MNPAKAPVKLAVKTRPVTPPSSSAWPRFPPEAEWFRNIRNPATKRAYDTARRT